MLSQLIQLMKMSIYDNAFIGLCIAITMNTITEDGYLLSFLNRFDKYIIAKPLWLCVVCSSFWYTLLTVLLFTNHDLYQFCSIPISMTIAIIYAKYI